ncbi:MAG: hypothetical protein D6778_07205, partial [Nitrospirae bacterium]
MNVILGAGLAGLSAAYGLDEAIVLEREEQTGGLARTLSYGPCRFDIGGHRFYTDIPEVQALVAKLLGPELLRVKRRSCIVFNGRKVPYPLTASASLKAMGPGGALLATLDYLLQRSKAILNGKNNYENLRDWVIAHFGRRLYRAYFKDYSEKVWGVPASEISSDWISKRIQNLDLKELLKSILFGSDRRTLIDSFLYPSKGIGRIAQALTEKIKKEGKTICTSSRIIKINHDTTKIHSILFSTEEGLFEVQVTNLISTIPVTILAGYLGHPIEKLRYRDLLLVVPVFETERLTEETWIYIPQRDIPFGRVHEPKNWSPMMAPEGVSHLVVEFFCTREDTLWRTTDRSLLELTLKHLRALGILNNQKPVDATFVRVSNAYPLFDIHYRKNLQKALNLLGRFENLILAGRTGSFSYLNMDEAIASGLKVAERVK